MQYDVIIVGQGISGTFLSYFLEKAGKRILVIDNAEPGSPSRTSAGIINPVTGRRVVTVWKVDEILPFAWNAYTAIGNLCGIEAISRKDIIDFFPNPFMRESFLKKERESNKYIQTSPGEKWEPHFSFEFGCGTISPVYRAHVEALLPAWQRHLLENNSLLTETFDHLHLQHTADGVVYKDIRAGKIIFCDGATGVNNGFFQLLPFAPNKGEALIVEVTGLPAENIYKKSILLAPLQGAGKDIFWCGSNYVWDFEDVNPSREFRQTTEATLSRWLKVPFKTIDHLAAVRPATIERRPFVGFHPIYKNIGLLNGMGTKGSSLAPFLASHLADHLLLGTPILPEVDIHRFQRMLTPAGS